jgi:DNA polymerase III alpha subunit (gram-positive type)
MTEKGILNKAYKRIFEIYGDEPDVKIISRFYSEKKYLQESELYIRYLELFGRIKEVAEQKGEHVCVRGTAGSSFVAYLLGATEINPLDIPFESNIKSVLRSHIQLCVSYEFFDEAKRMIYDEMWDKAIVVLRNEAISPTWLCFLDREENDDGEYMLSGNSELFDALPRITLVPWKLLDKYRELERATGVKMENLGNEDVVDAFIALISGNVDGIPNMDSKFMKEIIEFTKPKSYEDLLRLIGFAHGTGVWNENGEIFFDNRRMPLHEIPAYREDVYEMICEKLFKKGIYDTGFAYEVMEKARQGYYARKGEVDQSTADALLSLGFDLDFVFFLEKINYMFPRAHGAAYLKDAINLMWYKINFEKEFDKVM